MAFNDELNSRIVDYLADHNPSYYKKIICVMIHDTAKEINNKHKGITIVKKVEESNNENHSIL